MYITAISSGEKGHVHDACFTGTAATKVLNSMDKKTFQPGDFCAILTEKMRKGIGSDHHASHSEEMSHRCATGGSTCIRLLIPTLLLQQFQH
jgi:hypothetical protein